MCFPVEFILDHGSSPILLVHKVDLAFGLRFVLLLFNHVFDFLGSKLLLLFVYVPRLEVLVFFLFAVDGVLLRAHVRHLFVLVDAAGVFFTHVRVHLSA